MSDLPYCIGIDLGTWTSRVATILDSGSPGMLPGAQAPQEFATPSLIGLQPNECLVGSLAVRQSEFDRQVESIWFTRSAVEKVVYKDRRARCWSAGAVAAMLLRKLIGDAEASTQRSVDYAVIAASSPSGDDGDHLAVCAARLAGLPQVQTVTAAVAAATFHRLDSFPGEFHLVCDWGHEALRVTVLRVAPLGYRTVAVGEDTDAGGRQFAAVLISLLVEACQQQQSFDPRSDQAAMMQTHVAAHRALAALSAGQLNVIRQTLIIGGRPVELVVMRKLLLEVLQPLVERGIALCTKTLGDARASWKQVGRTVLVGGASQLPTIKPCLLKLSGHPAESLLNRLPAQAVASGAALIASRLGKAIPQEGSAGGGVRASPFDYGLRGLESAEDGTQKLSFDRLVRRETPLPLSVERVFRTTRDKQRRLIVDVVRRADKYSRLEDAVRVAILLDDDVPRRHPVRVELKFTETDEIDLEAFDHNSGRRLEHRVEQGRLCFKPSPTDVQLLAEMTLLS